MSAHEAADLEVRAVFWAATGLVLMVFVVLATVYWIFGVRTPRFEPDQNAWTAQVRSAPPLQTSPSSDWARVHGREEQRLHRYGWIDREAGVAHIPIELAMRSLVQQNAEVVIGPPEEER